MVLSMFTSAESVAASNLPKYTPPDVERWDYTTSNTGSQHHEEREDKDARDQVVEDSAITARYPILQLMENTYTSNEIINAVVNTQEVIGRELEVCNMTALANEQDNLGQFMTDLFNNGEEILSYQRMQELRVLQGSLRAAAALYDETLKSIGRQTCEDSEVNNNPLVETVEEDSAIRDRYPILQLKENTSYALDEIVNAVLTTQEVIGRELKVCNMTALANEQDNLGQFMEDLFIDGKEMLSDQRVQELRVLQGRLRAAAALYDETLKPKGRQTCKDTEDNNNPLVETVVKDAAIKARYPILQLKENIVYRLDKIVMEIVTTQKAIEWDLEIWYDTNLANVQSDLHRLMEDLRNVCEETLSDEQMHKLRVLQGRLRTAVALYDETLKSKRRQTCEDSEDRRREINNSPVETDSKEQTNDQALALQEEKLRMSADWEKAQQKIRDAIGPTYVQLLKRAKWVADWLPNYPDIESLLTQPYWDEKDLVKALLQTEDKAVVLAKTGQLHSEVESYGGTLLGLLQKLTDSVLEGVHPYMLAGEETANQRPLQHLSGDELKDRLWSLCQGVRRRALLESTGGCQDLWKQIEEECKSLCPDSVQLEVQDCVSALTKTMTHLSTLLQTVSEAARRPCLLEERVELVSSQAKWFRTHLVTPETSADLPSCRVRFLRALQRLLFLCGVCSLMAQ